MDPEQSANPNAIASTPPARGSFFERLGPAGLLGVVWLAAPPFAGIALLTYAGTISEWLRSHQVEGVWMYVGAFIVTAGIGFLPTYAQSVLGGFAFGVAVGVPAALAGFAGGSLIGYEIARRASGERVMDILHERPRYAAARDALVGGGFFKTLGIVTLLRLPPNSPFAMTNLVMASVQVPRATFLLGTLIGMAPRTAAAVVLGAGIESFTSENVKFPKWVVVGGIVLTLAILAFIGYLANKAMERVTGANGSNSSKAATPAP